jgi:8-oxo-dGTP pyrophosphatase MutT (NUDIX family)
MNVVQTEPGTRPAATVVLLRGEEAEILLLKRSRQMGFMANLWVFPGGRVDAEDASAAAAAIRETWEEAGVLLSDPPVTAAAPDEARSTLPAALRWLALTPFSRWVTPTREPKRFDTLFFAASVPRGIEAVPDASEVTEAAWLTAADALARHEAGALALAPPTWWTLAVLAALGTRENVLAWAAQRAQAVAPVCPELGFEAGKLVVRVRAEDAPLGPFGRPGGGLALLDGRWTVVP